MFLYQKTIDRSALREGFQIPLEFHQIISCSPTNLPKRGESQQIKIIIDGIGYDALLKNQRFDEQIHTGHSDIVQIRYTVNSPISKRLREIFHVSWDYVEYVKNLPENLNRKLIIRVPEEQQEYLALSITDIPNVFVAECITANDKVIARTDIEKMTELDFETFEEREDKNASIKEVTRIQRIRHLDRSIGDTLKHLYNYQCQMTGERVGNEYDALVVEAHHIIPFTESLNNDMSNIIILSPTYHRIIHRAKPQWLPDKLAFKFPNGIVEKVKINKHLKCE